MNDTARAREAYQAAVSLGTQNPEVYYQLGQVLFFQKKWDQALIPYQKAADIDKQEPTYPFAIGLLEETRRDYSKAIRQYKSALELDSTFAKALTQLHDLYLNAYQNETEAMKYNAQLLRVRPGHPLGRFQKGSYHLRRAFAITQSSRMKEFEDQINQAVVEFSIAVNRDPQFAQAWYNRGYCYFLGDRMNEAVQDFEQCIAVNPQHAPAHFMLGSINEKTGDLQTALAHYKRAMELIPENRDFQQAVRELSARIQ
jgi:tetratricopeptide (TPR) repeat protein